MEESLTETVANPDILSFIPISLVEGDGKKSFFLTTPLSEGPPLNNNIHTIAIDDLYMHELKPQPVEYKYDPNMALEMDNKSLHIEELKSSNPYANGDGLIYKYEFIEDTPSGDAAEYSNPSSDSMLLREEPVAIKEEQMGLKLATIDECDFNSSDSFSSTESIIPKTIECPKCPKKFMFKSDLARHDRNKHKAKQQCSHCSKQFPNQQTLDVHEKSHVQPIHTCGQCGKAFKKTMYLNKHMEQHLNAVSCATCNKTFSSEEAMEKHQCAQDSLGKFHCKLCVKSYESKRGLLKHMKKHNPDGADERPFKCELCTVTCSTRGNLRLHQQKHCDLRPHDCSECDKAFKSVRDLKRHMLKHSDERPFQCTIGCTNKTFKVVGDLKRHLQRAHPNASYDNATNSIKIINSIPQSKINSISQNEINSNNVSVFPESALLNAFLPHLLSNGDNNVQTVILDPSPSTVIPLSSLTDVTIL